MTAGPVPRRAIAAEARSESTSARRGRLLDWDDRAIQLTIRHVDRLRDIDAAGIPDATDLYGTRAWMALMEGGFPGDARYVVAVGVDGSVAGVLPMYFLEPGARDPYAPAKSLGLDVPDGRVAVLAGRWGYRSGWLIHQVGDRTAVLTALLIGAEECARRHGATTLSAVFLPPDAVELACSTGLVTGSEFMLHAAEAVIDIPDGGFDGYLASLSRSRRGTARREVRRFESAGMRVRRCRLSDGMDFAPRLIGLVQERHGHRGGEAMMRTMLEATVDALDDSSVLLVAEDPVRGPVACSMWFVHGTTLYGRAAGIDYELAEPAAAHFMTAYYGGVLHAQQLGLRSVHVGVGSLRQKVLRGAALRPLYGFVRTAAGPPPIADRVRAGEAKLAEITEQTADLTNFGGRLAPLWSA